MTGPEHYQEAERLLARADIRVSENWPQETGEHKADILAAAEVHATLALAAATMDVAGATSNGVVSTGWSEAIS